MNAPLPSIAQLSLVHYLTLPSLPEGAICDQDQIDALGNLTAERRTHALGVLAGGLGGRFDVQMRHRIVDLMRTMRAAERQPGARFLLDLYSQIEGTGILVYRERALQEGHEKNAIEALAIWSDSLVLYKEPLAASNVASLMPELSKSVPELLQPRLASFIDNLVLAAPLIADSEAAFADLEPRLESLNKALTDHGFHQEARALGKISIDLKLKRAFQ